VETAAPRLAIESRRGGSGRDWASAVTGATLAISIIAEIDWRLIVRALT
jgi:hypothetical protein